jgi:hypothetical protein
MGSKARSERRKPLQEAYRAQKEKLKPLLPQKFELLALKWFSQIQYLFRKKEQPERREKFALQRLEVYLILVVAALEIILPMLNVHPNFWIGLALCVFLTGLCVHAVWIWELIAHWSFIGRLVSSTTIVVALFFVFRDPLSIEWEREHCSLSAGESAEVVARVYGIGPAGPSGRDTSKDVSFQDLFQDTNIRLVPYGSALDVVLLIQDQKEPTDQIRVSPLGNAVITKPEKAWLSGFDEPTHEPDFFVRKVTFTTLSEPTTVTLRSPIKSRIPKAKTITTADLDPDRIVKLSAKDCKLVKITMPDHKTRIDRLEDQLRVLISRKEEGPHGLVLGVTRTNPDDPIPLNANDIELIQEVRCNEYPCKTLNFQMQSQYRRP